MTDKKTDRRTLKTRKTIFEGLAELLTEKELRSVTVQELSDRVDIHRVTFYKHFIDIYDVYEQLETLILEDLMLLITGVGDTVTLAAKADEGWKFVYWVNADTDEFVSMSPSIPVDVVGDMNLKAVFADASLVTVAANTAGNGQVVISNDGSAPVFSEDRPLQNVAVSAAVGDTLILGAKADEGWRFTGWRNAETDRTYSTDAVLNVEVSEPLFLTAIFEEIGDSEPIRAEHTSITYGRNGNGIVINTTSKSDRVAIRIDGGTAATNETEGLRIENGTVSISKELADKLLKDGENHLNLVFSDGTLEVMIYVTNEGAPITPGVDAPKTGDASAAAALSAVLLGSFAAALLLVMKRKKNEEA